MVGCLQIRNLDKLETRTKERRKKENGLAIERGRKTGIGKLGNHQRGNSRGSNSIVPVSHSTQLVKVGEIAAFPQLARLLDLGEDRADEEVPLFPNIAYCSCDMFFRNTGTMTSNGAYNLTVDGELRYLVQWFGEWSDFQREDFVPYLVSYLSQQSGGAVYMNGLISAMSQINPGADKPMSLFQCRVKLFNEWCIKWPEEFKAKLLERLEQIDGTFGVRIRAQLDNSTAPVNGCVEESSTQLPSDVALGEFVEAQEPASVVVNVEASSIAPNAILVADED
uniref:Uncharacterized protein n=1 Tax=Anopheles farauti TaxID=69004 RepID=A0A182QRE1_9DIPT